MLKAGTNLTLTGELNGSVVNIEDNFYRKSQTSLNHYWTINDQSLSTAVYASWGTGGGGGTAGDDRDLFNVRLGGDDQPVDLDNIVKINRERGEQGLGSIAYLRASRNDHEWYGVLSTYKSKLSENISFLAGLDIRSYIGKHFSEVTDLLGGSYVYEDWTQTTRIEQSKLVTKEITGTTVKWDGKDYLLKLSTIKIIYQHLFLAPFKYILC